MQELILLAQQGPVVTVTLNRPVRHNSFTVDLLEQLLRAICQAPEQPGARAVLLRAAGRSFSTGGDVAVFYQHEGIALTDYAYRLVGLLNDVVLAMLRSPLPIVGRVHGAVTGGALGLVLGCDVVYVTPNAGFTPYYSVVGFSPDGGWTALLPQIIGYQRVAAILAQNRTITAQQAVEWGLATALVAEDDLDDVLSSALQLLTEKKAGSLAQGRRLLLNRHVDLREALERERSAFVSQIATAEARQGMVDFLHRDA
jgi:2-(1,2-epoxy-1,2-dihydrophenyl)acetyl-CoA isomerase